MLEPQPRSPSLWLAAYLAGVGLGMTIAREAAQRMGGQLTLEATPGGGLTAVIRLPRI
jgi:signal transduction histidine kinase